MIVEKSFTLKEMLYMALGSGSYYFSKELAPPMAICNAKLFIESDKPNENHCLAWNGDCDIHKDRFLIHRIATTFGVTLGLYFESNCLWLSNKPDIWLGYSGPDKEGPLPMCEVFPYFEKLHQEMVLQWKKDNGFFVPKLDKRGRKKA